MTARKEGLVDRTHREHGRVTALGWLLVAASVTLSSAACNLLFGIDAPNRTADGGAGREGAEECLRNSDCDDGNVCLFRVCSSPCEADEDCSPGSRCLATADGRACVSDAVATCTEDAAACPSGTSCTSGSCRIDCSEDATACLNGQVCVPELGACVGTDPAFDPGGGSCEAPETRCTPAGQLQNCSDEGVWGSVEDCTFVCVGDTCGGDCTPEDTTCDSAGAAVLECDENGVWQERDDCGGVCTDGACEESCEEGTYQCSTDNVRLICSGGSWDIHETCEYVCDAATRSCAGSCEPGTRACGDDEALLLCDASGELDTLTDCPNVCIEDAEATGGHRCATCDPDAERCEDNAAQTCTPAATWMEASDCTALDKTCAVSAGTASCGGDCAPGQESCISWDAVQCSSGSWVPLSDCTEPTQICKDGACVANTAFTVGNTDLTTWGSPTAAVAQNVYAIAFSVPVRAEVVTLNVATTTTSLGTRLGIYSNSGTQPGTLLVQTANTSIGATTNQISPTSSYTLEPDTTYWIAVVFGQTPSWRWLSGSSYTGTTSGSVLPASFPVGAAEDSFTRPLSVTVREVPAP